ncbi:cytochrome P450 [Macrolepiota fuliginosa MF-IS2]|uniref:Cytochrome P450 n=1 Tax=Macrolepiota fuliginosa MF-IS2 TaxID=1400762 RepID=A0A9P5XMS9_9AGAR|nr:cytochrome P450 [Macrolepiota fuliginosa MF-IS2]
MIYTPQLNAIPTVGHSGMITSYITAKKWMSSGGELLHEGYNKFQGRPFKIATISRWLVVLSGKHHVEEICKAPNDVLSFSEPAIEATQADYTFGTGLHTHPHHIATIRSSITRSLSVKFDDIRDEIVESLKDYIPRSEGWVAVPAYETLLHIVCRTTNRYLIGLPLCRDPKYRFINEQFTIDVATTAKIVNVFPDLLKPLVGKFLTAPENRIQEAYDLLCHIIEERLTQRGLSGRSDDQPNDVITWLLETATHDYHFTVRDIVLRILIINFTAIHTSTMALTQGVYDLAVHPEYIDELREEAQTIISEHGWTKLALQKMRKIDSFLKESHRLSSASGFLMVRKTLKSWMLSDGTVVPPDVYVGVAVDAMNKAESTFRDAQTFKGLRFAEMREGEGDLDSIKHQMVSLSAESVVFGHGRHACPGRFLAVNVIKSVFTHILLDYDIQLENGSLQRPPNVCFEAMTIPNPEAKLMFRKRSAA